MKQHAETKTLDQRPARLKPTDPAAVPWSEKCAACGHSRAHHIAVDGPCNVLVAPLDFCRCDRFSAARAPQAAPVPETESQ